MSEFANELDAKSCNMRQRNLVTESLVVAEAANEIRRLEAFETMFIALFEATKDLGDSVKPSVDEAITKALLDNVSEKKNLKVKVNNLENLLVECIDLAEEGWSYAVDYFKVKWKYKERLESIKSRMENKI